jgi:hypothetical protein
VLSRRYRRRFAGAREPVLAVPGATDRGPTNDEISDSSKTYADHFDVPVPVGAGIRKLERRAEAFVPRGVALSQSASRRSSATLPPEKGG